MNELNQNETCSKHIICSKFDMVSINPIIDNTMGIKSVKRIKDISPAKCILKH